ncbi:hypothetical protein EYF80_023877 [Liparis tanakae]|uniref:Uncharacterized protein n=1 Tax=Liparis tanakae TaxID=230148 RepID=A0A4Z2HJC4_9TELE|nr:hypothetical protein EYF80_023877 [Liparis tanakae]
MKTNLKLENELVSTARTFPRAVVVQLPRSTADWRRESSEGVTDVLKRSQHIEGRGRRRRRRGRRRRGGIGKATGLKGEWNKKGERRGQQQEEETEEEMEEEEEEQLNRKSPYSSHERSVTAGPRQGDKRGEGGEGHGCQNSVNMNIMYL